MKIWVLQELTFHQSFCHSDPEGAGPISPPPWFLQGTPSLEASDLNTIAQNPQSYPVASLGSSWQSGPR